MGTTAYEGMGPGALDQGVVSRDGRSVRRIHFHDPDAPVATAVVPSVFVAVRGPLDQLLLVRRCDSGSWEFPGGRVDVGENAVDAAVRETREEAAVQVRVTGLVGLYTDPGYVVRAVDGSVRQQFVVVFTARGIGGTPCGNGSETSAAMWVAPRHIPGMSIEPVTRSWIEDALRAEHPLRLA